MAELISRDWVLKNLLFDVDRDVVRKAPAVDAEPVVRCKDCVHLTKDRISAYMYGFCQKHDTCVYSENFFCAYGMRRNACG